MGIAGNTFGPAHGSGYTEASSVLRAEASDSFLVIPNDDFVLEAGYELNMYRHAFITVLSGGWITESSIFFARVIRRYNSSVSTICSTS